MNLFALNNYKRSILKALPEILSFTRNKQNYNKNYAYFSIEDRRRWQLQQVSPQ